MSNALCIISGTWIKDFGIETKGSGKCWCCKYPYRVSTVTVNNWINSKNRKRGARSGKVIKDIFLLINNNFTDPNWTFRFRRFARPLIVVVSKVCRKRAFIYCYCYLRGTFTFGVVANFDLMVFIFPFWVVVNTWIWTRGSGNWNINRRFWIAVSCSSFLSFC